MTAAAAVRRVGVLGCGLMGGGIAQTAATAGYDVVVREPTEAPLAKGRRAIETSLAKLVEKGKLAPADRQATLDRLTLTTTLDALAECDLVIEAVTEDLAVKNALWRDLDGRCPPATVFASNTSSLRIGDMAAATRRPDRFVGLHFFNPVPLMPLVEVVRAIGTSAETFERAMAFARSLGKEPVAARDTSGFLVNLLLVPYLLDAVRAVERGVGTVGDLDTAMRLGAGHPMGPLTLLDFIGVDTVARIAEIMFDEYRDSRYAPPPLLRRMVAAGLYGRKSGRGFYDYSATPPVPTPDLL
jgi:3-hydroxybutyryl-CoA dehydrogenase